MIYYISNPKISDSTTDRGYVSLLDNSFVYTAKITQADKAIMELNFEIGDETADAIYGFKLSTTEIEGYSAENGSLVSEPFSTTDVSVFFFEEEFRVINDDGVYKLYKRVTEKDYGGEDWADYFIEGDKVFAYNAGESIYTLRQTDDIFVIFRAAKKEPTISVKSYDGNTLIENEVLFDDNNIYYTPEDKWYRFVVSEGGKLITIWRSTYDDMHFDKLKTFSFPGGLEKAYIKFGVADRMLLSDMSFSFFKTNVV